LDAENDPNHALVAFQKSIEVEADYFGYYQDLCQFHSDQANYEEAVQQCRKMVNVAPALSDSHMALALPYLWLERFQESESEFRKAISLQETYRAVFNLGVALMWQNKDSEAIPYYSRALGLGAGREAYLVYLNMGDAYRHLLQSAPSQQAYR